LGLFGNDAKDVRPVQRSPLPTIIRDAKMVPDDKHFTRSEIPLRGKKRRDQQLERVRELQFAMRVRVGALQSGNALAGAGGSGGGGFTRPDPASVAAHAGAASSGTRRNLIGTRCDPPQQEFGGRPADEVPEEAARGLPILTVFYRGSAFYRFFTSALPKANAGQR
jgi:hypothetical protein